MSTSFLKNRLLCPRGLCGFLLAILVAFSITAVVLPDLCQAAGDWDETGGPTMHWLLYRLIQFFFFGVSFLVGVFFLISPMILPSFRSVGSPDEIIEETGLGIENTEGKKLLLAYDTRHGTTATTAQKMGHLLAAKGCQVDVRCIKRISEEEDLSGYDAYVVGSWIYYMKVSATTIEFLKKFKEAFEGKPVAYFVVCGKLLTGSLEEVGDVVKTYVDPVLNAVPEIKPLDIGMFPGGVILSKLSLWEKVQMWLKMRKLTRPRMVEGIFIDDGMIDRWTTKLVGILAA